MNDITVAITGIITPDSNFNPFYTNTITTATNYTWGSTIITPSKEETKMTEYVVEKQGKDGPERQKLTVSVGLNGSMAVLSETETQQLAELVCKLLSLKFVGRA